MIDVQTCKHCGGNIEIRNPCGDCDHLYWPDMLTDEAKIANGLVMVAAIKRASVDNAPNDIGVGSDENANF